MNEDTINALVSVLAAADPEDVREAWRRVKALGERKIKASLRVGAHVTFTARGKEWTGTVEAIGPKRVKVRCSDYLTAQDPMAIPMVWRVPLDMLKVVGGAK